MKSSKFLYLIIPFALCAISFSIDNEPDKVVEIEKLNPELYKSMILTSLNDNLIEITEACVPAKVLTLKTNGLSPEESENYILNFFSSFENTGEVQILENFSPEMFRERCSNARLGK